MRGMVADDRAALALLAVLRLAARAPGDALRRKQKYRRLLRVRGGIERAGEA